MSRGIVPGFPSEFSPKLKHKIWNGKPGSEAISSISELIFGDKAICFTSQTHFHSGSGLQTNKRLVVLLLFAGDSIANYL